MATLTERWVRADKALTTFRAIASSGLADVRDRDAAIMRFAYTFEASWKVLKAFLAEREEIDAGSPAGCVRALRRIGLLTDDQAEASLRAIKDRNLVVHTYNEALARELAARLNDDLATIELWLRITDPRAPRA